MNDWISVQDEMPLKFQKVLFYWICEGSNGNISMGYYCESGWDIYLPYYSFGLNPNHITVTHWMKLPDYPE